MNTGTTTDSVMQLLAPYMDKYVISLWWDRLRREPSSVWTVQSHRRPGVKGARWAFCWHSDLLTAVEMVIAQLSMGGIRKMLK